MLKQFSKNISIYGIAPAFSKGVGFFLVPVYTRVFSPAEYGVIDLFNMVIHLVTVLINLQIYSAVGRYFNQSEDKKALVSTAMWNEIFLSIIVLTPLIYFSKDINILLLGNTTYNTVFILALVWVPVNVLSTFLAAVMRYEDKPVLFVQIIMLQTIVRVGVALVTILGFNFGIEGIFIGHLAGDLCSLLLFLYFLRRYIGFTFNIPQLRTLLLFSLPLVPATFVIYGNGFLNRAIMLKYISLSSLGIFAVALKVTSAFELLSLALRMAWEPFVYANLKRKDHKKQFVRIYKMITMLLCLFVCGISLFADEILFIITTEEYYAAANIVRILAISAALEVMLDVVGIGPRIVRKTIYDSITHISGAVLSVLLMLFLTPLYGMIGAAVALGIGSGASLLLGWHYTEKSYPIGYPKLFSLLMVLLMGGIVVLSSSFGIPVFIKLTAATLFFLIVFYYRDLITKTINSQTTC